MILGWQVQQVCAGGAAQLGRILPPGGSAIQIEVVMT